MIKSPLGTDEKVYSKRHERLSYWKKFSAWRKGYRAAKKGKTESDNPYVLSPDELELLRKRTRWLLGFQEAYYRSEMKRKRKKVSEREIKKFEKEQKKKNRVVKEEKKHGKHKHPK